MFDALRQRLVSLRGAPERAAAKSAVEIANVLRAKVDSTPRRRGSGILIEVTASGTSIVVNASAAVLAHADANGEISEWAEIVRANAQAALAGEV